MEFSLEEVRLKLETFCAYQERSVSDVRSKCVQLKVSNESHDELIQHLQETGFLDESRYAESYVSGKFRIKKWGRRKIYAGLRSKGIDSELIPEAMKVIEPEDYWETLLSLAEKKHLELSGKKNQEWETKIKLMRFLLQRGFENDLVSEALDQVVK